MPTKKFTVKGIDAIRLPASGRVEYWDKDMPGFGLRVSASGRKSWVLLYRVGGRLRRRTLGTFPTLPLKDARELAGSDLHKVVHGIDPAVEAREARDAPTFGEMAEDYMVRYAMQRKRSWRKDRQAIDRDLLPRFKHRKAAEIRRREFIELLDDIKARGAPIQANRTLEIVRRIYNWGIINDYLEINPCQLIEPPGEKRSRDRVLSNDEIRRFWSKLDDLPEAVADQLRLLLLTGQRKGEISRMRWADIDMETGVWTIPTEFAKNRLSHRVPLSKTAKKIVEERRGEGRDETWVFLSASRRGPLTRYEKRFWALCNSAGLEDFVPHDLRRTVSTRMAGDLGVARLIVERVLNHKDQGVASIYDRHSYDKEKREALEAWGKRLQSLLESSDEK